MHFIEIKGQDSSFESSKPEKPGVRKLRIISGSTFNFIKCSMLEIGRGIVGHFQLVSRVKWYTKCLYNKL